jgi:hypothetical protein
MAEGDVYKYKLVWQEKENDWNTAVGNSYNLDNGIMIFEGSKGVIVLSPCVKWIVK